MNHQMKAETENLAYQLYFCFPSKIQTISLHIIIRKEQSHGCLQKTISLQLWFLPNIHYFCQLNITKWIKKKKKKDYIFEIGATKLVENT